HRVAAEGLLHVDELDGVALRALIPGGLAGVPLELVVFLLALPLRLERDGRGPFAGLGLGLLLLQVPGIGGVFLLGVRLVRLLGDAVARGRRRLVVSAFVCAHVLLLALDPS